MLYDTYKKFPREVRINEKQLNELLIHEKLHYNYDIEPLLSEVMDTLNAKISNTLKQMRKYKVDNHEETFNVPIKNSKYIDNIEFTIKYDMFIDTNKVNKSTASYYNENPEIDRSTGKMRYPTITVKLPFNNMYYYDRLLLKSAVSHELTHLIDDYEEIIRDNTPINYRKMPLTIQTMHELGADNKLYNALFMLLYTGYEFEKKAFINQAYNDLKRVGCNPYNYKEVYKKTDPYITYTNMYNKSINIIQNASDNELEELNFVLNTAYTNHDIPRMNIGYFTADEYRAKLINMAKRIRHDFMKKYGGIITAYLEDFNSKFITI